MFTTHKIPVVCAVVIAVTAGTIVADEAAAPKRWETTLAVGANLNRGNTESMTVNTGLATKRDTKKMEYRFGVEGNYGENTTTDDAGIENTEKTAQNAKAYANIKRKFGKPYVYSDNNILHDDIGGIDHRIIVGLGGGSYVVDGDKDKLALETGLAYIFEKLKDGEDDSSGSLRLAFRYDHAFSKTAKFWAATEYLPTTDDLGDYLLNSEAGVETVLNGTLNLRVVAQNRYDSTPPNDLEENDLSLIAALVYKP